MAAVGLFVVIRIHPWYEPQYAIPILGMILGNTLTGVSLGIERMTEELTARRDRVDMALALGATRWEAAQAPARRGRARRHDADAESDGRGRRRGPARHDDRQVLAGQSPLQAVRYQIVIMFLIAASSALGTVGAVLLTYRRLFSAGTDFCRRGWWSGAPGGGGPGERRPTAHRRRWSRQPCRR